MPKGSSAIGSADESMSHARVERLMAATAELYGIPTLAYMTMNPGWVGREEIESLWFRKSLVVAFGYHTNSHKTIVDHSLVCPSTNGEEIKCAQCRRCITPRSC